MPKIDFYNLRVDSLDRHRFFGALASQLNSDRRIVVNFLNAHCFNVAQTDPEYRSAINRSTFLLNDGVGIDIAARLRGIRFPENLNGTDLIPEILGFAEERGLSVFLLGAQEEVIAAAAAKIRKSYANLQLCGSLHGFVADSTEVIRTINKAAPDLVIVGMGVPKQELWVDDNAAALPGVKVFVCGGAIFDFLSGKTARAPLLLRHLRLEWLFRLFREPRRLFSRYVLGSFRFAYNIAKQW